MKKLISFLILLSFTLFFAVPASAEIFLESDDAALDVASFTSDALPAAVPDIPAPSAILMEKETGTVLFEKNADERLSPASVTKIMTILLICEEIEAGKLSLDDTVTASARAASMGGSQIFLRENEKMSVRDLLKSIVVSSANDAAVAMAEHIAGSEEAFADRMNERAAALSMTNTHFSNCTGLLDQPGHLTTARDIALMSRELLRHEWIRDYTTIWTDTVRSGEFGLSNTNKLIRYYSGATGLKTGFTSKAGYCLSGTAMRDGVEYIAVVLNCKTSQDRFESVKTLLSYGFANYCLTPVSPEGEIAPIAVRMGTEKYIQPVYEGERCILTEKSAAASVTKTVELCETVEAPVCAGDRLGTLTVKNGEEILYEAPLVSPCDIPRLSFGDVYKAMLRHLFGID